MKKIKFLAMVLCMFLAIQYIPVEAQAANPQNNIQGSVSTVAKVAGLKTGITTVKSINIRWMPVAGTSGYEIYRSTARDGKYTLIKTVAAGGQAFCNVSVKPGKEYFYQVRAFVKTAKGNTYGEFSKILRANTKYFFPKKLKAKYDTNIRKYAGTKYETIAVMQRGTSMKLLCESEDAAGTKWYRVQVKINKKKWTGYVRNDLVV